MHRDRADQALDRLAAVGATLELGVGDALVDLEAAVALPAFARDRRVFVDRHGSDRTRLLGAHGPETPEREPFPEQSRDAERVADRRLDRLEGELVKVNAKLANEAFVAKVPPAVLAALKSAVTSAMAAPETRDKLGTIGVEAQTGASEELRALLRRETTVWTQVIKDSGITVQ